jgi:SAM-dependent methyltransferase
MLVDGADQTLWVAGPSLRAAERRNDVLFLETIGCSDAERREIERRFAENRAWPIDPVVDFMVAHTNGILYQSVKGRLPRYPIPDLRLPPGDGKVLLDVGCSWGRWCVAAARKGYSVVGLDPSLGAIKAARRVSQQLGAPARFVVGDAMRLPFAPETFDVVFSYSVLQHFGKESARLAVKGIRRVVKTGGTSLIQMANVLGIRSLQHQLRRGFREPKDFEVRYWSPWEMKGSFNELIGESVLSVDGYFGLGMQTSDVDLMPRRYRIVVRGSEVLRKASMKAPFIGGFADSLYIASRKGGPKSAAD